MIAGGRRWALRARVHERNDAIIEAWKFSMMAKVAERVEAASQGLVVEQGTELAGMPFGSLG